LVSKVTNCCGEYLNLRQRKPQEDEENYVMRSFIICICDQIIFDERGIEQMRTGYII
jgi:hypothetical protein